MKFHELSEIFPLIEGQSLDDLAADIKANGLREKIWTYEGKILDGRNRFLACQRANVKPEFRKFTGKDPLAFIVSLNIQRRHLTDAQRAMAAAKIATMRQGERTDLPPREARLSPNLPPRGGRSQTEAAAELGVSVRSVQRAKKVIDSGSKALQHAVESNEVPLKKAASVVNLPKSVQLAAAKAKPEPKSTISSESERFDDIDDDEAAAQAAYEREIAASVDKVMQADDKLASAYAEIKRQAAFIVVLESVRDGLIGSKDAITKLLKAEQSKTARLQKKLDKAESEIEKMRERIAIMEVA